MSKSPHAFEQTDQAPAAGNVRGKVLPAVVAATMAAVLLAACSENKSSKPARLKSTMPVTEASFASGQVTTSSAAPSTPEVASSAMSITPTKVRSSSVHIAIHPKTNTPKPTVSGAEITPTSEAPSPQAKIISALERLGNLQKHDAITAAKQGIIINEGVTGLTFNKEGKLVSTAATSVQVINGELIRDTDNNEYLCYMLGNETAPKLCVQLDESNARHMEQVNSDGTRQPLDVAGLQTHSVIVAEVQYDQPMTQDGQPIASGLAS